MIETVESLRLAAGVLFWLLMDFLLVLIWAALIFVVIAAIVALVKWSME